MKLRTSAIVAAGILSIAGIAMAGADPQTIDSFAPDIDSAQAQIIGATGSDWVIVDLQVSDNSDSDSYSYFDEFAVDDGPNYNGSFLEYVQSQIGSDPVILSDSGFFLSPTEIPLDSLNDNFFPPPGEPGSQMTPLPSMDGTLEPGNSVGADIYVPEPASMSLLAAGSLALLCRRRKTRHAD